MTTNIELRDTEPPDPNVERLAAARLQVSALHVALSRVLQQLEATDTVDMPTRELAQGALATSEGDMLDLIEKAKAVVQVHSGGTREELDRDLPGHVDALAAALRQVGADPDA